MLVIDFPSRFFVLDKNFKFWNFFPLLLDEVSDDDDAQIEMFWHHSIVWQLSDFPQSSFYREFRVALREDPSSVFSSDIVIENSDGPIDFDVSRVYSGQLEGKSNNNFFPIKTRWWEFLVNVEGTSVTHIQCWFCRNRGNQHKIFTLSSLQQNQNNFLIFSLQELYT